MSFNLLRDALFPVVTRSGRRRWASLAQLAVIDGPEAPVAFDWPRADFNIAACELAVGLTLLLFRPQSHDGWRGLWDDPPSPEEVERDTQAFVHAFDLLGDGPRFMQDLEAFDGEPIPVEALLIDTPGANGQKKNADLLTWRGRYPALGLPAAAMALYALQQFAPAGGAGNRTSMRGGGPLTTLVTLDDASGEPAPLWRVILANLPLLGEGVTAASLPRALPWLAPTILSDAANGGRTVSAADPGVHELQAFFGQPRRIRLVGDGEGVCAMTGAPGKIVTGFVQKAWGVNYGVWRHPLTPYRRQKEDGEPYSAKPKSGHFGYRDWVAAVYGAVGGDLAEISEILKLADRRAAAFETSRVQPALMVGGWAMNNMEAIAYLHALKPLYLGAEPLLARDMALFAGSFSEVGELAHRVLRMALRKAHFSDGATVATDRGLFEQARSAFFERTEGAFHAHVHDAFAQGRPERRVSGPAWLRCLRDCVAALFTELTPDIAADPETGRRVASAWNDLQSSFAGYGKLGAAMFDRLDLPAPETKRKTRKA
ncbi:MAG: type I-E CRISPR-associated protein Cse1/CasA [Nitratireductor sp.]